MYIHAGISLSPNRIHYFLIVFPRALHSLSRRKKTEVGKGNGNFREVEFQTLIIARERGKKEKEFSNLFNKFRQRWRKER